MPPARLLMTAVLTASSKSLCAGCAAAVDQSGAAHVAVGDLVAAEIDGMIAGQVGVDALVEFAVAGIAHVERRVAAVILREFLFDDVGFDGHAEMIGLSGKVGGEMIVLVFLEGGVAEIAPQNGGHAEFVSVRESLADFDDLAIALIGAEIDGGADGDRAHVVSLLNAGENNLVGFVGVSEQFVVIELHEEGNLVRVLAGDRAEHAERGSYRVALAFDGQLDDIFAVEIIGILSRS